MATEAVKITYIEAAAPSTPAAGRTVVYAKADGLMYSKDDAGAETLMSGGSVAAPTFVAAGVSASGTGDITPGLPAGHTTNDILLLFVQSSNQTATAPAGWAQLGPAAGFGTAATALSTRGTIFWKRHDGSEVDPTVTDTVDHTLGQIVGIRGCVTTGDPFLCIGTTKPKLTASTTGTASAGATPWEQCLVVNAFFHGLDSATAVFSSWTNASLASITEAIDVATADGTGGGIGVAYGVLTNAGNFVATTVTETSTTDVSVTFIMLPAGITKRAGFIDRQVFLTPGFADTWTKPTGAMIVDMVAIGGGASGSAGRNAATAAGGGGGGGGATKGFRYGAGPLAATLTVTAGAGGAATAHVDGTASNAGNTSSVTGQLGAAGGAAAGVSATGSGGLGGNGGGAGTASAAGVETFGIQRPGGGTGGTTAGAGGSGQDNAGGAGAGGGTSQAASAGGSTGVAGAGGGGGRSNTNVGTGGYGAGLNIGGASASAAGTDSAFPELGGGGGAGGTSASGTGGTGGWPGGGGGGGGSQSGAQGGGKGGDGVVVITTFIG